MEKVCITAGPEFGTLQGHCLIIVKALYGLRTSSMCWHERLADVLRSEGFMPCKSEPDIWLRENGPIYEYIGVYVDDLAIAMESPKDFIEMLRDKHNFKIKAPGPLQFHLGTDFYHDEDGALCMAPQKYIERLTASYEKMFERSQVQRCSPLLRKATTQNLMTLSSLTLMVSNSIKH